MAESAIETEAVGTQLLASIAGGGLGIATLAIALCVAIITYRNFITARDNLRLSLFDKRFEIYKELQIFLASVMKHGDARQEDLPALLDAYQRSRFLFDDDIPNYFDRIIEVARLTQRYKRKFTEEPANSNDRKKYARLRSECVEWLTDQLIDFHLHFGPYMQFSTRSGKARPLPHAPVDVDKKK